MRLHSLLLGTLFAWAPLSVSLAQRTAVSTTAPATARYIVVMDGEPAAATFARVKAGQGAPAALTAARARVLQIRSQHDALGASLRQLNVSELGRFSKLVNAVHIRATAAQAAAVRRLPGVKRVDRVQLYQPETASSVPFVGTAKVWGGTPSADGSGMRLGIIDSGIDYTHADFGGSGIVSEYTSNDHTVIEPGTFPTAKVADGWDFVGDDYNADDSAHDTPSPDPDPIDCLGHGSHVAGIAAGFGVLTNGATFAGPYTNAMDFTQFKIGPGVAPRATLYALKVFGCSGSTSDDVLIQALEWAADPNNDSDFSDHLDVVNLSIGSIFGLTGPDLPFHDAINQLADLGCVPVFSAGNSGETFYIVSSGSTAEKAISVACSIDNATTTQGLRILSPASIVGTNSAVEGAITVPLSQTGPIQGNVVYVQPNDACSTIVNGGALAGNIALIDRGSCNFNVKILAVQSFGAIGVIMVNNVATDPIIMGGDGTGITIPGVMISQADGATIKAHLGEGVTARMGADTLVVHPELTDQLASFSSRGPAAPASALKPEISAPGFSITSVKVGGGTAATDMSGTSMAAPHIAGAAVLMRQLHPDWSTEDIKAALMNSSRPMFDAAHNAYPESRIGAGRLEIDDAAREVVTATAENSGGLVSLSFGALVVTNNFTNLTHVVLTNHSAVAASYNVVVSNTVTENGVTITSLASNVTVPAHGSTLVPVQFSARPGLFDRTADPTTTNFIPNNPSQLLYETSGEIWFQNTNLSLHVPYYANVRAAANMASGKTTVTIPITNASVATAVPDGGASAHPQPLVSVFQLGATSENQGLTGPDSAADLLAVGAASDASTHAQFTNSTIYFGIAVAGNWAAPQPDIAEFDIDIDTNGDGIPDFTVLNTTVTNLVGSFSDIFKTAVAAGSTQNFITDSFINGFSASQQDTAPFNNSVLVMPVTVRALNLSSAQSQIRYRVTAYGPSDAGSQLVDQTDWITFDAAHPVFDTASQGLSGRPFFVEGSNIPIRADVSAAGANGFSSPSHVGLLLLHHMNALGQRVEVLDVQFAPKFLAPQVQPNGIELSWSSASNGVYTLQYATNLSQGFIFQAATGVSATPPINTFLDSSVADPVRFYRVIQQ